MSFYNLLVTYQLSENEFAPQTYISDTNKMSYFPTCNITLIHQQGAFSFWSRSAKSYKYSRCGFVGVPTPPRSGLSILE